MTTLSELRDSVAERIAHESTTPEIRSMYPSRSRGQMKNEFMHFIKTGWDAAIKAVSALRELERKLQACDSEHLARYNSQTRMEQESSESLQREKRKTRQALDNMDAAYKDRDHWKVQAEKLAEALENLFRHAADSHYEDCILLLGDGDDCNCGSDKAWDEARTTAAAFQKAKGDD